MSKSYSKIQLEGYAMMRAGLNKAPPPRPIKEKPPKSRKTASARATILRKLFSRQDGRCHLCGEPMAFPINRAFLKASDANIDHYIPRSKGGSNSMSNLRAAHYECNSLKGNKFYQSVEPEKELLSLDP